VTAAEWEAICQVTPVPEPADSDNRDHPALASVIAPPANIDPVTRSWNVKAEPLR